MSKDAPAPWFETFMETQHGLVTEFIQKDALFGGFYTAASPEQAAYGANGLFSSFYESAKTSVISLWSW